MCCYYHTINIIRLELEGKRVHGNIIVLQLCFVFVWLSLHAAVNVSVQYNGGVLPDIILLTQCYYHRGTSLNAMKRFCFCSLRFLLNVLTFFPSKGCSEGLGAFRFFDRSCMYGHHT